MQISESTHGENGTGKWNMLSELNIHLEFFITMFFFICHLDVNYLASIQTI